VRQLLGAFEIEREIERDGAHGHEGRSVVVVAGRSA
jgi:hypothetical protein